ncbi:NAD(P)H-hydrate dehydratase [Maridesulfovibrio bastinii]|uniref:NAD(P)H-hydrate dehydratase n=1 Tax=Maridesulfovibrio bastinii TaxID=47157 RepID=UPI00040B6699|nr:NAD(P)H-hydrate dehydratase [Maridesulfovibrio bastinii]
MFSPLPTPAEMNLWDNKTINEIGIHGDILMENASREATRNLQKLQGDLSNKQFFIICGPGNNGGDGFAMGRQLMDFGARVTIFHTHPQSRYTGDAEYNFKLASKIGVELKQISEDFIPDFYKADIIIDALLGTGFEGELRPNFLKLVNKINESKKTSFILSIDIPSGLHGEKGIAQPEAVHADATITFEAAKIGLRQPSAEKYTGKLIICPIGIPKLIKNKYPVQHFEIEENILKHIPFPAPEMHKGTSGHLLIVGGSPGITGALQLAGLGALRAGTGLVTLACPSKLVPQVKTWMPELMTHGLGNGEDWDDKAAEELISIASNFQAIVIGPGLGRSEKAISLVEKFSSANHPPCVFDADALYAISKSHKANINLAENSVLTPHPGEMATLISSDIETVQKHRIETARNYAKSKKVYLVLKGAGTVIGCPDNKILQCSVSAPNLATGGSGDILAGIIGSLLARGLPAMQSSAIGVYWHARSGQYLSGDFPFRGNLSTETANSLPKVLKEILC